MDERTLLSLKEDYKFGTHVCFPDEQLLVRYEQQQCAVIKLV